MKIVVTGTRGFPDVQGGVEKHCEKLYTHLADKGCDVIVFTRSPYTSPDIKNYKGVTLVPVGCPRSKFLEALVHTFKCIMKARKLHPDILHIHAVGPTLFAPLARLLGMKVVVTNHGPDYKREKWNAAAKLFLMFCEWSGMTFANEIIAISKNIADDIQRKYNRKASILPNGIELSESDDLNGKDLAKYGLQKNKFILAVGRFVPEKGFHDLMDVFSRGDFKGYKLVIAGDADHEDDYSRKLKSRAHCSEDIILTGFLTEQTLKELYSNAALFVLPSYYEGLPIALLEAMSFGTSCIASDIPANRNIPLDESRFFKAGDIASIRNSINEFLHRQWHEEDRQRQRRIIYETYNWGRIAEETLKIYKKLAS